MKNNVEKYTLVDDDLFNKQKIQDLINYDLTTSLVYDVLPNTVGVAYSNDKYVSYLIDETGNMGYPMPFDNFNDALNQAREEYDMLLANLGWMCDREFHPEAGIRYNGKKKKFVFFAWDEMNRPVMYETDTFPEAQQKANEFYRGYLASRGLSIKDFKKTKKFNR